MVIVDYMLASQVLSTSNASSTAWKESFNEGCRTINRKNYIKAVVK